MLTDNAICLRRSTVSVLSLLACCLVGCQTGQTVDAGRPEEMLTVGGIFWPGVTPGFETETGTEAVLFIPAGSVCDVRVHPGTGSGRAMVKVDLNQQWHFVWVDKIASRDYPDMHFLPFDTFPYLSCGSENTPDRNWDRTQQRLIRAADAHRTELSDEDLRILFGKKTFDAYRADPERS